jgi:HAD superfamily hydrolase (TIGR01450 family)
MTHDLSALRAFIFDLDGCVYTGNTLVPGVQEFLRALRAGGRKILFLTNNSREAGDELLAKLTRLGVFAAPEEMLSAAEITGPFVLERFGPSKVLVVGSPRFLRLLAEAGHTPVPLERYSEARVVAIGHDFEFDYQKLTALSRAVSAGAAFVAVNADPRLPVEGGEYFPGCGAIVEAVAAATGIRPEVVGKPNPHLFRVALARLQMRPEEVAMVGDSLNSDVKGAQGVGLRTIWIAPPGAVANETRPDLTIHHFSELAGALSRPGL